MERAFKALGICKCCKHSFPLQYTRDELLYLYYDEDQIERHEWLQHDYPGQVPELRVPRQDLCPKCLNNPRLERVYGGLFGPDKYRIRPEEDTPKDHE